jgi:mono/diheme cytochrome c family protein
MKYIITLFIFFLFGNAKAEPGLQLQLQDSLGQVDARSSRLAALFVKDGEAASPFLEAGSFEAEFSGKLQLKERSRLYFSFIGSGQATLSINGETVIEAEGTDLSQTTSKRLRLNKGDHDLKLTYKSPASGPSQIRLLWQGRDFPLEPVAPTYLTHTKSALAKTQDDLRQGRQLVTSLNCTKCHSPGELSSAAMPELSRDTPTLQNAGNKYNESWMAAWIQNPKNMRHSATMPKLLKHSSVEEALQAGDTSALDLAAYLATLKTEELDTQKSSPSLIKDGGDIFHKLGCISCHTRPDKENDKKRLSLSNISSKYSSVGALSDFLKNPAKHYKWIRMPDFKLNEKESLSLAAFLMDKSAQKTPAFTKGNATKGKDLYKSLGCISCHDANQTPSSKPLSELKTGGCLDGKVADYSLSDQSSEAISKFLQSAQKTLSKRQVAEFSSRQIKELNCQACHDYDLNLSDLSMYHAESEDLKVHEGKHLDQFRPLLTWIGEKLQTDYLEDILAGKNTMRPRPWLDTRMPAFKERSKLLAEGLAADHGLSPEKEVYETKNLVKEGKQLLGTQGGFSCVICHDAGPQKALAAFEAKGIDLQLCEERLRPAYYKRWMLDPSRIVPSTKMPKFSNKGETSLTTILEGNAEDQFMAIFEFLMQGRKLEKVK